MPLYQYKCEYCGKIVEEIRSFEKRDIDLPVCGCKGAEQLISMFPEFTEMKPIISQISGHHWKE